MEQSKQHNTVSTDDWREALFLLLLRAREIYQSTEELDEATVPQILQLFEVAHSRGFEHKASELLAVILSDDDLDPSDIYIVIYVMNEERHLQREDFEAVFQQGERHE